MKISAEELRIKLQVLELCVSKQSFETNCFCFRKGSVEAFNNFAYGKVPLIESDITGMVASDLLLGTLSALKTREVELSVERDVLHVKSGRFSSQLALMVEGIERFDDVAKALKVSAIEIKLPEGVLGMCNLLLTAQNFSSATYKNIFFRIKKRAICTDGFRLFDFESGSARDWELPSEAVNILSLDKEGVVKKISVADDFVRFTFNGCDYVVVRQKVEGDVTAQLIDNFKIVEDAKIIGSFEVPERLLDVIERIQVVSSKVLNKACTLSYMNGKLTVKAAIDNAHSEDSISVKSGKPFNFNVLVNYEHFLSLIQSGIEGAVNYSQLDGESAIFSKQDESKSFYISANVVK